MNSKMNLETIAIYFIRSTSNQLSTFSKQSYMAQTGMQNQALQDEENLKAS